MYEAGHSVYETFIFYFTSAAPIGANEVEENEKQNNRKVGNVDCENEF